jgi:hypothetical protein
LGEGGTTQPPNSSQQAIPSEHLQRGFECRGSSSFYALCRVASLEKMDFKRDVIVYSKERVNSGHHLKRNSEGSMDSFV